MDKAISEGLVLPKGAVDMSKLQKPDARKLAEHLGFGVAFCKGDEPIDGVSQAAETGHYFGATPVTRSETSRGRQSASPSLQLCARVVCVCVGELVCVSSLCVVLMFVFSPGLMQEFEKHLARFLGGRVFLGTLWKWSDSGSGWSQSEDDLQKQSCKACRQPGRSILRRTNLSNQRSPR